MFDTIQVIVSNIAMLIFLVPLMPLVLVGFLILLPVYIVPFLVSKCGPFLASSASLVPQSASTLLFYKSNTMKVDSNGKKPHSSFSYSVVAGEICIEKLRTKLQEVLEVRNAQGSLKYPGMKQIVEDWMGFPFLESTTNFDISQHVKMYTELEKEGLNKSIDETKLGEIICNVRKMDFAECEEDKPPWEVLLVKNFTPDLSTLPKNIKKSVERKYCVLLFHCGNGAVYGSHWDRIFIDVCDESSSNSNGSILHQANKDSDSSQRRVYEPSFMDGVWSYAKYPFTLVKKKIVGSDRNSKMNKKSQRQVRYLHSLINATDEESSHEFLIVFGKLYESEYFKRIGESLHVNVQSVMLAAILGGLRRFIDYSYLHTHRDFHDFFKVRVPITLGNGFKLLNALDLPLAEPDPLIRLQIIDKNVQNLSLEAKEICPYTKSKPFGSLMAQKSEKVSAIVSSTIASEVQLKLQGNMVIDRMSENFLDEDASIVFNMTKYAGRVRLNLIVDRTLIPYEDDGKILFGYVDKEFQVLENLAGF